MNIDVIVGCQYGSEAKGLVASMIADKFHYDWIISVNSAQAGHTVMYNGTPLVTRHLPSGAVINQDAKILIGAGAIINREVLRDEIYLLENDHGIPIMDRLYVHEKAVVIDPSFIEKEKEGGMFERLGSTCEGVGETNAERAMRKANTIGEFQLWVNQRFLRTVNDHWLLGALAGNILLEGSQGFDLSLYSHHYPKCTSRDTTTAAFLSYARLSPRFLRHVYGVYRTFPIRVAGNSGYMYGELSWEDVANISGYKELKEITTVTKRVRRVGMWDGDLARRATFINGVDRPILTFANYINRKLENRPDLVKDFMDDLKLKACDTGIPWYAISTSREGGWWFNNKFK